MPHRIVGRDAERTRITEWLTSDTTGYQRRVLTGSAGAGKTALWDWTVGEADGRLRCHGPESPRRSCRGCAWPICSAAVPAGLIDALPAPQRHTLRVVMLLDDGDETVDARAVGTGVWTLLGRMSRDRPLLIALDDLPNIDPPSAAALAFALRRLQDTATIRIVGTSRAAGPPWTPLDALDAERLIRLEVGPLTVAAIYELLHDHLGLRLHRPMLLRVHETSAGNPLYALELARALDRTQPVPAPGLPLPVPAGLDALIGDRVRSQPAAVRTLVAGTAAAWRLTDSGVDAGVLAAAADAGLVLVDGRRRWGSRDPGGPPADRRGGLYEHHR